MEDVLIFKYRKGIKEIFPAHNLVSQLRFNEGEEEEAILANAMAAVGEKTGLTNNDLMHLLPVVLRILKSNSEWCK